MTTLSPSSRGLLPGLLLALAAAFAVLALNDSWLLPSLDDDGMVYLLAAPQLAAGETPEIPSATWESPDATQGIAGRGTAMPLAMAAVVRAGRRPHVAALWLLALSAGLVALTAAWVGGGVAGLAGGVASALAILLSPLMMAATTSVRPEVLVTGLVGLQLGVMVYRPTWSWAQGLVAALAWLTHPVGVGAVAAAVVWPLRRHRTLGGTLTSASAALPALVLMAVGYGAPLLLPPSVTAPTGAGLAATLGGILHWASAGWSGFLGILLGLAVVAAVTLLVLADRRDTPPHPAGVHWSDPAAADALQAHLRPAAAVLALALLVASVASAGVGGTPSWTPVALPLAVLAAATAVRKGQGRAGARSWLPAAVLVAWLAVSGLNAGRAFAALREDGRGHTAAKWVASEVIRWVDNRSAPFSVIYASDPGLILLQSGRNARALPATGATHTGFIEAFRADPGPVILSGSAAEDATDLAEALGLVEVVRTVEGRVLVPRENPSR